MNNTEYKTIPGFKRYLVAANGSHVLDTKTGKVKEPSFQNRKYASYGMLYLQSDNGHYRTIGIHRCVALAFLPISNDLAKQAFYGTPIDVHHIDSNTANNTKGNLKWTTHKENINLIVR